MMNIARLLTLLAASASPVLAVDHFWNVPGPADWNNAANWLDSGTGPDDRFVNNGGIATITATTILPIRDTKIALGADTSGTVNHSAGDHFNGAGNWTFIGEGTNSNGTYNIADTSTAGGTFTGFGTGSGNHRSGQLRIGSGTTSIGTLRVNTSGTITVNGGALVDQNVYVGLNTGGDGRLHMDSGTINIGNRMHVGDNALGILRISGGAINVGVDGAAPSREFWVGQAPAGNGTVLQTGGTITVNNWIAVGRDRAVGTYTLSGGSLVGTGTNHMIVGSLGGQGTFVQTGTGNLTLSGGMDFRLGEDNAGVAGNGNWDASGGTATIGGNILVGWLGTGLNNQINLSGTVDVTANNLLAGDAAAGRANLNGGTLRVNTIGDAAGAGLPTINFNGTTIVARSDQSEFFPNLSTDETEIQAGGLRLNTNGFSVGTSLALDGAGGLTKLGLGTLTLNGASIYTGVTTVTQGTLALGPAGSLSASSTIVVAAGATFDASAVAGGLIIPSTQSLEGNGTVTGNTTVAGTLAPGNSIGTLTVIGALTLNGTTEMELDRTGAPASDLATATGAIDYGGSLDLILLGGTLLPGDTFNLFDAPSFLDAFASIDYPAGTTASDWINNLSVDGTLTFIPEPSAAASLAALSLLALARRRRA